MLQTLLEFAVFAAITWAAGIWLTRTTDAIDAKYKLGSAFGGLLILGITTSLPEISVAVSAALQHHYGIIIGTLVGGIAMQTVVISLLDARMKERVGLTFDAASLTLVVEATLVILVTVAAILAIRTPVVIPHTAISLTSLLIFGLWLGGLWLVYRIRQGLPWRAEAMEAKPGREHHERRQAVNHPSLKKASNRRVFGILALASLATLIAGVGLQSTGNTLAGDWGIGSGLFAATFIAFAGALPNISTGFASIDIGDYKLAMSDIFGGNAFMPALFIVCDIVAGQPVLKHATSSDIWFAAIGVLVTCIYIIGLIVRPRRVFLRMGIDSILGLCLYITGLIILTATGG
jgi:cation:H+ antiporter